MARLAPKINRMLIDWLPGDVHSLHWLEQRDVSQSLAWHYCNGGSLERLGAGIYARKGDRLCWEGGVRLLQEELNINFHVSGQTALELVGAAHFVPMGDRPLVLLTTYDKRRLPKWFKDTDFGCEFRANSTSLFPKSFFYRTDNNYLVKHEGAQGIQFNISCRELAIMELINALDLQNSLETAQNYVNNVSWLRADIVQSLLENCTSVEVKRVFLYLSDKTGHQYFSELDVSRIDLGKGKRQVVKRNAKLDKKYLITVDKGYEGDPL